MSFFNWFDELKCQHEYEFVGQERGENFVGLIIYRKYYKCRKCLKERYEDYAP